jgi:hypothetical protein
MKRVSSGIMRRFTSALTATVVLMNLANAAGDLVWFNGGFDNENGLASERNTQVSDARTYDNFSLPSGYNVVTGLLGQFYLTSDVLVNAPVYWEIRQGAALGTGGTLIASGTQGGATYTAIGSGFGFTIYEIRMKLNNPVNLCTQHRLLDDDGASGQRQWSRLCMPRPTARAQSARPIGGDDGLFDSAYYNVFWVRSECLRWYRSSQLCLWRPGDSGACEYARAGRGSGGLAGSASPTEVISPSPNLPRQRGRNSLSRLREVWGGSAM